MGLDLVQIDIEGNLTGMGVTLQREQYSQLLWELEATEFPLLARMGDYYDDASFERTELPGLQAELQRLRERHTAPLRGLVDEMVRLVGDSIQNELGVEVIAD